MVATHRPPLTRHPKYCRGQLSHELGQHEACDVKAQFLSKPFKPCHIRRTMFTGVMRWLSNRVRRLHLSTHIRVIHWDFVSELESSGWRVVAQYAPLQRGYSSQCCEDCCSDPPGPDVDSS